ncbi:hypothetical protein [Brevundimonas sp.]|jgi:hypothetical protein|nr:hypothetical protein [Brevundimonas sp.]
MPMTDRTDNPFWPAVPKKRPRWPRVFVFATIAAAGVGVLFTAVLNG